MKYWLDDDYIFQEAGDIYALLVLYIAVCEVSSRNKWEICVWIGDSGWTVQFGVEEMLYEAV